MLALVDSGLFIFAWPTSIRYVDLKLARRLFVATFIFGAFGAFSLYYSETIPLTPTGKAAQFFKLFSKWGTDPEGGYFIFMAIVVSSIEYLVYFLVISKLKAISRRSGNSETRLDSPGSKASQRSTQPISWPKVDDQYLYVSGAPPDCLEKLYYLPTVVPVSILVVSIVSFLLMVILMGGTGDMMAAWCGVAIAEATLIFAASTVIKRKLEDAVTRNLPKNLHLIYRFSTTTYYKGAYQPEIIGREEFKSLFYSDANPESWTPAKMCYTDKKMALKR